jgi:hypothetical protein
MSIRSPRSIVVHDLVVQRVKRINLPYDFLMGWTFPAPPSAVPIVIPHEARRGPENGRTGKCPFLREGHAADWELGLCEKVGGPWEACHGEWSERWGWTGIGHRRVSPPGEHQHGPMVATVACARERYHKNKQAEKN